MELKRLYFTYMDLFVILLIVPYGIETGIIRFKSRKLGAFNRTLWN